MIKVFTVISRLTRTGGIPNVVRAILRESDPHAVRHFVCQVRPLLDEVDEAPSLESLYALNMEGNWTRSPKSVRASIKVHNLIRELQPDVVHLHTGSALMALPARLLSRSGTSWLFDFHEPMDVRHSRLTSKAVMAMARRDGWSVCHSPQVMEKIAAKGVIPEDRMSLVPLGIDTGRFDTPTVPRGEWRSSFGLSHQDTVVITVGKVSESKGMSRLLDVAQQLHARGSRVVFLVAGSLADSGDLKNRIDQRGLQDLVRLLGHVKDLPSALHASDVYFTPSEYEGFGLAATEAMAAGLPVVASSVGGLNFVVEDSVTGYLIEKADIDGYVNRLERLLNDPKTAAEMGQRGRQRSTENFDEMVMVRRYVDLYEHMANR